MKTENWAFFEKPDRRDEGGTMASRPFCQIPWRQADAAYAVISTPR
jgi:hypothetical protein